MLLLFIIIIIIVIIVIINFYKTILITVLQECWLRRVMLHYIALRFLSFQYSGAI